MSDEIKGPAKIIAELQEKLDEYERQFGPLTVSEDPGDIRVQNDIISGAGQMRISGGASSNPIPVAPDFAGIKPEAAVPVDTPTDALAVLALRVGDLERKFEGLADAVFENEKGGDSSAHELISHLYSVLGFKKPDPGNG